MRAATLPPPAAFPRRHAAAAGRSRESRTNAHATARVTTPARDPPPSRRRPRDPSRRPARHPRASPRPPGYPSDARPRPRLSRPDRPASYRPFASVTMRALVSPKSNTRRPPARTRSSSSPPATSPSTRTSAASRLHDQRARDSRRQATRAELDRPTPHTASAPWRTPPSASSRRPRVDALAKFAGPAEAKAAKEGRARGAGGGGEGPRGLGARRRVGRRAEEAVQGGAREGGEGGGGGAREAARRGGGEGARGAVRQPVRKGVGPARDGEGAPGGGSSRVHRPEHDFAQGSDDVPEEQVPGVPVVSYADETGARSPSTRRATSRRARAASDGERPGEQGRAQGLHAPSAKLYPRTRLGGGAAPAPAEGAAGAPRRRRRWWKSTSGSSTSPRCSENTSASTRRRTSICTRRYEREESTRRGFGFWHALGFWVPLPPPR